jgi:CBS domain containing-hemolysin-like protein
MLILFIAVGTVLLVSCICSLLEAALYSLSASQIEILAKEHRTSGKILKKLYADIQQPISAILTLNTLANTGGAAIAGAAFVGVFPDTREAYFTIAISLSVLIFSEIIPKTAGVVYARPLARLIAHPIQWLVWIFAPFIWLNRFITQLITRGGQADHGIAPEEIAIIARMSRQAGSISHEQERVISNILSLENLRVRDIMTPRTVVFTLNRNLSLDEARLQAGSWPHSRVPLYAEDREAIVALALRRDVFLAIAEGRENTRLSDVERAVHTVPEAARASQLLQEYITRREHLFVVVDEYGVFSGVITLEDVIEEIVGQEIVGEFDPVVDMRERARRRGQWFKNP